MVGANLRRGSRAAQTGRRRHRLGDSTLVTFPRPTAPQPHATFRSFWLGACVGLALAASACVGPDLEPPGGGSRSSSAPGSPADVPNTNPEGSAAAGKGGLAHGDDASVTLPPKTAAGGAGGSSSNTGAFGTDQDAGVEDAGVDASASH